MEAQLVNRYSVNMHGVLSCYDRIVVTGTLPGACYAAGMTSFCTEKVFAFLTMRSLQNLCGSASGLELRMSARLPGLRWSMSARVTSAKKTWCSACCVRAGMALDWCM